MPFKKGASGNPKGRRPGKPNKATTEFKEALTRLLNDSAPDFKDWLEAVPAERRLELIGKLAEYVHPKLGRTEVTGKDDGPVQVQIVKYGEAE